jgi:hypothetical protein
MRVVIFGMFFMAGIPCYARRVLESSTDQIPKIFFVKTLNLVFSSLANITM